MLQTRGPALSGNALKGIAILAMTLDHLTWTLWPGYATDCGCSCAMCSAA